VCADHDFDRPAWLGNRPTERPLQDSNNLQGFVDYLLQCLTYWVGRQSWIAPPYLAVSLNLKARFAVRASEPESK
jgi:hypothetical protein